MTSVTAKGLFDVPSKLYLGLRWDVHDGVRWDYETRTRIQEPPRAIAPQLDTVKYPLGFVTYADKQDAAFEKRKKTVDDWAYITSARNYESSANGIYLDNDPLDGFQIFDFESRWTTSNKWFCVKDPRGFHLQISAAALIDLFNHTDIKKGGHIQGKCVWGRRDGTNIIVPVDSDLYKETVKLNAASKAYNIGDQVIIGKQEMVYLGELFHFDINVTDAKSFEPYQSRSYDYFNRSRVNVPAERTHQFEYNNQSKKLENQQIVITSYDSYWNDWANASRNMTIDQLKDLLSYNIGTRAEYPKKKVFVFAVKSSYKNDWLIQEYKSRPKIKGVLSPYVVKDNEPNPMDLVAAPQDEYEDAPGTLQHTFNLGEDVYSSHNHTFRWQRRVYFKDLAEMQSFDLNAVLAQFPNRIECISAEEVPLPDANQYNNGRFTRKAYKITYEGKF